MRPIRREIEGQRARLWRIRAQPRTGLYAPRPQLSAPAGRTEGHTGAGTVLGSLRAF